MKFEVRYETRCNCGFPTTKIIEANDEKQARRIALRKIKELGGSWYIAYLKPKK